SRVSVCLDPPPFDIDIWVDGSLAALFEVWMGKEEFAGTIVDGRIRVRALPWQERQFSSWFSRSPGVPLVKAELARLRSQADLSCGRREPPLRRRRGPWQARLRLTSSRWCRTATCWRVLVPALRFRPRPLP